MDERNPKHGDPARNDAPRSIWEEAEATDGPLGPEPAATSSPPRPPASDELSEKLKPVVAAAEDAAAKAVVLSTKGLNKLGAMLERRRRDRGDGDHGPN